MKRKTITETTLELDGDDNQLGDLLRDIIRDELTVPRLPKYLSSKQAGEVAGVHPATVRGWVKRNELRAYWAGNDLRIKLVDLEAYLGRRRGENVIDLDAEARRIMNG